MAIPSSRFAIDGIQAELQPICSFVYRHHGHSHGCASSDVRLSGQPTPIFPLHACHETRVDRSHPLTQVKIHALWGTLLALYAPARIYTYVLMWARSAREVLSGADGDIAPRSPPPTEAIAAFFLTSGGVAFISSTEQIGFWAMRSGRGT